MNTIFLEEMEVLQSIYEDELVILESDHSFAEVKLTIHPNTADDQDGKYVCLTLHFCFNFCSKSQQNYPNKEPHIFIKNPRGLADSHLASIEENLKSLAASMTGEQMLYSLVEYAKDSLTDNNHPSCNCPICLEKFEESDNFFRTPCYHYFHRNCIKSYIEVAENIVCPVCRLEFQVDETILSCNDNTCKENDEKFTFVPDETFINWRRKCDTLYEKQRRNGGIIDLEFEKNKYLITQTPAAFGSTIANENTPNEIVTDHFLNSGSSEQYLNLDSVGEPTPVGINSANVKYTRTGSPKLNMDGQDSCETGNHSARLDNSNISENVKGFPKDRGGSSSYYKDKAFTAKNRNNDKISNNDVDSEETSNSIKNERMPRNKNNYKYRQTKYDQRDDYQKRGFKAGYSDEASTNTEGIPGTKNDYKYRQTNCGERDDDQKRDHKRAEKDGDEKKISEGLKAGHLDEGSNNIKTERTPRNKNNYKYRRTNYDQRDGYQKGDKQAEKDRDEKKVYGGLKAGHSDEASNNIKVERTPKNTNNYKYRQTNYDQRDNYQKGDKRAEKDTNEKEVSEGLNAGPSEEVVNNIKTERVPRKKNNYNRQTNYDQRDNYQKRDHEQAGNYRGKHSNKHKNRHRQGKGNDNAEKSCKTSDTVTNTDELPESLEKMPPPELQMPSPGLQRAPPGLQRAPPGLQRAPPGLQRAPPGLSKQLDNLILTPDDTVHSLMGDGNLDLLSNYEIPKEGEVSRGKGDMINK